MSVTQFIPFVTRVVVFSNIRSPGKQATTCRTETAHLYRRSTAREFTDARIFDFSELSSLEAKRTRTSHGTFHYEEMGVGTRVSGIGEKHPKIEV